MRQAERRHPQSRRNEWLNNGIAGTRQGKIQAAGSDTSPKE